MAKKEVHRRVSEALKGVSPTAMTKVIDALDQMTSGHVTIVRNYKRIPESERPEFVTGQIEFSTTAIKVIKHIKSVFEMVDTKE